MKVRQDSHVINKSVLGARTTFHLTMFIQTSAGH